MVCYEESEKDFVYIQGKIKDVKPVESRLIRGLGTYTAMSGENTETKIKPHEQAAHRWFSKD